MSCLISLAAVAERWAKGTHLGGNDRKTTALVASARGFHGGVECQNIGLESNQVDHADDVDNFARRGIDC